MIIAIAADHAGFFLKKKLVSILSDSYQIIDLGAHEYLPADDYTDYAINTAQVILRREAQRGIIICGSGVGACIAANKVPGIRACVCHDIYSAHQGVEHDWMNILCLGANIIGIDLALELISAFLHAEFLALDRYKKRLIKIEQIEADCGKHS